MKKDNCICNWLDYIVNKFNSQQILIDEALNKPGTPGPQGPQGEQGIQGIQDNYIVDI